MNRDTLVTLIKRGDSAVDEYGNPYYPETRRDVFAEKKSVRQTEFFQAFAVGFKPEIVLEIYDFDYKNEEFCELDGERFTIYRSYPIKNTDRVEIYLTAIVGDTNAFA
jgi:SPP1 family predicted phage head-tail adaptor